MLEEISGSIDSRAWTLGKCTCAASCALTTCLLRTGRVHQSRALLFFGGFQLLRLWQVNW